MMIAFTSFSQTVISKDSTICLPPRVLKGAAKDIIRGDECIQELKITQQNLDFSNSQISIQKEIINNKDTTIQYLNDIMNNKDQQMRIWENQCNMLNKQISHMKTNNSIKLGVAAVIICGLTYLLISK